MQDKFNQTIKEWEDHCKNLEVQLSSSTKSITNCNHYQQIINMGKNILPLIKNLYNGDNSNNYPLGMIKAYGLTRVINKITKGDFEIPENLKGDTSGIEQYTKNWLNEMSEGYV